MATQTSTLAQDAALVRKLRQKAEALDAKAEEAKTAAKQAEIELFERMEHEDVGSIRVGDTNFVRAETVYGNVNDRSEFIKWAETNMSELLEMKERKALVNELVREHIDNGQPLPPGLGFYVKQYVSQRAA